VAVAVVVDEVDVLASHEQGVTAGAGAGTAAAAAAAATAAAAAVAAAAAAAAAAVAAATIGDGAGGDTSSVVSIELSSLSSDTLRTRVMG